MVTNFGGNLIVLGREYNKEVICKDLRQGFLNVLGMQIHDKKEVGEMGDKQEKWACAHCGYTASGKFVGDICPECGMTYWKCSKCGFLITTATPPRVCTSCGEKCDFINVTCYTPECGGPGHIDPRL